MAPSGQFSVCVLLYGDYPDLAKRCLGSIETSLDEGQTLVHDFRIGLNAVAPRVFEYVGRWAQNMAGNRGQPVYLFVPPHNVGKCPLMRKMFYQRSIPLARYVMWFDDDSFLVPTPGWWQRMAEMISKADVIGQTGWGMPIRGNQWEWVRSQPWFNKEVGLPPVHGGRRYFRFVQGAWWVVRSEILSRYRWPPKEMVQAGDDCLFGELCRHQRIRVGEFTEGVRINADEKGVHSASRRRGMNRPEHGADHYLGKVHDTSHQQFQVQILRFAPEEAETDRTHSPS